MSVEDNILTDLSPLQATEEELLKWQKQDPTLARVRKLVPKEQEQMNIERVYVLLPKGYVFKRPWPIIMLQDTIFNFRNSQMSSSGNVMCNPKHKSSAHNTNCSHA